MTELPQFALFGADPLFTEAKPTGNLYRPEIGTFLEYSRAFHRSRHYGDGELCASLEARLARFHEVARVVSVNSGFWGHVLAISALARPGRREVVAPAFGYRRTDDMIAWAGLVPHFCDVDRATLGVSVDTVRAAVSDDTALILAPHPMVNGCDAQGIEDFGRARGIPVVFDSVEAAYRMHNGRRIGGFGNAEVFSMHATKLLNGFEGGYVTTNDRDLADRLQTMKRVGPGEQDLGRSRPGLDATLSEMHAAMALASLDGLDGQIAANKRRYELYVAGLRETEGLDIIAHKAPERPDYRMIVVRIGEAWPLSRDDTLRLLEAENILARPYYTPLDRRPVVYPRICPDLPVTKSLFRHFMVLPSGAHVSERDVEMIVDVLARIRRHGPALRSRLHAQ